MSGGTAPDEMKYEFIPVCTLAMGVPLSRTLPSARMADAWRTIVVVLAALLACWKNTRPPTISASATEIYSTASISVTALWRRSRFALFVNLLCIPNRYSAIVKTAFMIQRLPRYSAQQRNQLSKMQS